MKTKILHFVWIPGFDEAPEYAFNNIERWRHLNPDFEVKVWEEEEVLDTINPSRVDVFRSIGEGKAARVKKADFARLEIVIEHGGIYLDCDLEPHRPISDFLKKKKLEKPNIEEDKPESKRIKYVKKRVDLSAKRLIFSREWKNPNLKLNIFTPRTRVANGLIMADEPGSVILDRYLETHYKRTDKKVLHYLGPHSLTRFLEKHCNVFNVDDLCVVPPQHFLWESKLGKMPKWSISKHMGVNTWGDHTKHDFWNVK